MFENQQKYKRFLKPFKNVFVLILIIFCVWMLFFDSNSWFIHNELNNEIDKLEEEHKLTISRAEQREADEWANRRR
mgnify:CR=1 FL=1